jgi:hypothetical protein
VRAALATGERPPRHEEDRLLEAIAKSGFPDDLAVTKTANFLVNRRMNKAQQMRWSRRGANLLLQVRCAIHNGTLGSGFGQKFHPANDTHSQAAVAARPPILRQSPTHNVKLPRRRRPAS